jgi:hypothetical protein
LKLQAIRMRVCFRSHKRAEPQPRLCRRSEMKL